MLFVLQREQGIWAHQFVLEFARLANGHVALSLIVATAGGLRDARARFLLVANTVDGAVRVRGARKRQT